VEVASFIRGVAAGLNAAKAFNPDHAKVCERQVISGYVKCGLCICEATSAISSVW